MEKHFELQKKGWLILGEIEKCLQIGMTEKELFSKAEGIFEEFGVSQIWHPTTIKFDENTLNPGISRSPSTTMKFTEMAIIDIGVVLDGLEVDCGRSYGISDTSQKLAKSAEAIFEEIKPFLSGLSPAETFQKICTLAEKRKLTQIAESAGHKLGPYPTPKRLEKIQINNTNPSLSSGGWMVEIHVSDGKFGAFFEDFVFLP